MGTIQRLAVDHPSTSHVDYFRRSSSTGTLLYVIEAKIYKYIIFQKLCWAIVLKLSHPNQIADHLCKWKRACTIPQKFNWPILHWDMPDDHTPQSSRVPLVPLTVIEEPFQRIAMDIVGPISRSHSGRRYFQLVYEYGTCYLEAFQLMWNV